MGQEVTVWFGWSAALIRQKVSQKTPTSVPGGGANTALRGGSIGWGVGTERWMDLTAISAFLERPDHNGV